MGGSSHGLSVECGTAARGRRRQSRAHRAGDRKFAGVNPLDCMMLVLRRAQIIGQDLVGEAAMAIQLQAPWLH
jgi:hypothetical protein